MQTIGIIGSLGDLGSQLVRRAKQHGFIVREFDIADPHTSVDNLRGCTVVHVCAPLDTLSLPVTNALIVLHDSVMATSQTFNAGHLNGDAAVVHLLMNKSDRAIVASDQPHAMEATTHLTELGLSPVNMPIDQHDAIMARSQAPLALLCDILLPELFELDEQGLLTPSGEALAQALHSRELVWTPATRRAILRNPHINALLTACSTLVADIQE